MEELIEELAEATRAYANVLVDLKKGRATPAEVRSCKEFQALALKALKDHRDTLTT